ncbi:sulfatase and phosphatidylinositolglycan class N domain-containing protein [Wolffia australiana]
MAVGGASSAAYSFEERRWRLRRREMWLVVAGIALHAVFMLSIFDIYFKSPVVHGMDAVPQRIAAPARRLVLIVGDGLRADKLFGPDSDGQFRAKFLRSIIREKGRWGISHARPPTESRPGHVSLIAGFYEDPSAITKGWKANPVEFDSVFNRSSHVFAFGSPGVIPIFCGNINHTTWASYPPEFEDFASDASFLDEWSFDQFHDLLRRSHKDSTLKDQLMQERVVIFLHLLGCDTNGHAHRPHSEIYSNNVRVVDSIAQRVQSLFEDYYGDDRTAYIFTADHGISDKGSHGDGHPTNTETPLVVWGAGIRNPSLLSHKNQSDHRLTPANWNLDDVERIDVNQADIAPLMSTLIGSPCPVNSVGSLPTAFLNLNKRDEAEVTLSNTKQILNQFLRKSDVKQSSSLHFKPFKPLENYGFILKQIEDLISQSNYEAALMMSQDLRNLALAGLHYFQTYDWLLLMTFITLGYIGWIVNLFLHILQSYTSLQNLTFSEKYDYGTWTVQKEAFLGGFLLTGLFSLVLLLEKSPVLYHAYSAGTIVLWAHIFGNVQFIVAAWRSLAGKRWFTLIKLCCAFLVALFIVELLVYSFSERKIYTMFFIIGGASASSYVLYRGRPYAAIFLCASCWFLSAFTLMPAEIPENTGLVIASGAIIILVGLAGMLLQFLGKNDKIWSSPIRPQELWLFSFQVIMVLLSSVMVWVSTSHRSQKRELLLWHQITNWLLTGVSLLLPLLSSSNILPRLISIFMGFAPPFLLLCIGYEAVFYSALSLVLMGWIVVECVIMNPTVVSRVESKGQSLSHTDHERCLHLSDLRVPLTFMVLFNVAFFGTGNFASIASFEISSVYRFVTVFSPFFMAALLIFKLFIPFMLVICMFSSITKLIRVPRMGFYFLVILLSDFMTIHFFFLVQNTGSWMEIGNSISHFGIMSAQVVFILLLFALTNVYTRDIKVNSLPRSPLKLT